MRAKTRKGLAGGQAIPTARAQPQTQQVTEGHCNGIWTRPPKPTAPSQRPLLFCPQRSSSEALWCSDALFAAATRFTALFAPAAREPPATERWPRRGGRLRHRGTAGETARTRRRTKAAHAEHRGPFPLRFSSSCQPAEPPKISDRSIVLRRIGRRRGEWHSGSCRAASSWRGDAGTSSSSPTAAVCSRR